jgi:hypothetical protein
MKMLLPEKISCILLVLYISVELLQVMFAACKYGVAIASLQVVSI